MKQKFLLMTLLAIGCSYFFVHAQKRDHHLSQEPPRIPFGKKLPPPEVRPGEESSFFEQLENEKKGKNTKHGNMLPFDSSVKTTRPFGYRKHDDAWKWQQNRAADLNPGKQKNLITDFHLTKDINLASSSEPRNYGSGSNPHGFAVGNNVAYFAADDGIHGREIWRSDGTAAGTYLFRDVNPGEPGSDPGEITFVNNKVYFIASDAAYGEELWVSDGTDDGTIRLTDMIYGPYGGRPSQIVNVGTTVFFTSTQPYQVTQLWQTNGTRHGTRLTYEIPRGSSDNISQLTSANGLLFFTTSSYYAGIKLWRSDGTGEGTYPLRYFGSNYYTGVVQLTGYNDRLYFSANDGTGNKLWISDGTPEGTTYAPGHNDIILASNYVSSFYPTPFAKYNNHLYLSGFSPVTGAGLFKYDASNAHGVELVKDISAASDYSTIHPGYMQFAQDILYFKVVPSVGNYHEELWKSDGSEMNTQMIKRFLPGEFANEFRDYNRSLVFSKYDPIIGTELWTSDGSSEGTRVVKDIMDGMEASYPSFFSTVNGKLIFNARNDDGAELWTTNGTEAGTYILRDINTHSTEGSSPAGFYWNDMAALGKSLFFGAYTSRLGRELYQSDGSASGTSLVKDINPAPRKSAYARWLLATKKNIYFHVSTYDQHSPLNALYKTDGTSKGTTMVIDFKQMWPAFYTVAENGIVYYVQYSYGYSGFDLFRTDGTEAGTFQLAANLYYSYTITIKDNQAYFISGTKETGWELWKSDGTKAGTKMVKDIYPGSQSSHPYSLFEYKGNIYFGAYDGVAPYASFWKTDGTKNGTVKVKDLAPGFNSLYYENSYAFSILDNTLYFAAFDYQSSPHLGHQLWKTDGTSAGTQLVKNINPGASAYPQHMVTVGNLLFFLASDESYRHHLWVTDGTTPGTRLVKDIGVGREYYDISRLVTAGGRLFFLKNRYRGKPELWSSDGTAENTQPVYDDGLAKITRVFNIATVNNKLFVMGYSYRYGDELYVTDVKENSRPRNTVDVKQIPELVTDQLFDVTLFPNPAKSVATVLLSNRKENVSIVITDIAGKVVWQRAYVNALRISLPMDRLTTGLYTITVKDAFTTKTMKLVKQ